MSEPQWDKETRPYKSAIKDNYEKIPVGKYFRDLKHDYPPKITSNKPLPRKAFKRDGLFHWLLEENLEKFGINQLAPVQKYSIPYILRRDVNDHLLVRSPTGTGKSTAYLMAVLSDLLNDVFPDPKVKPKPTTKPQPFALIILPTRELVVQVCSQISKLIKGSMIKLCCVYGGTVHNHQEENVKKGCNVLVATPRRLATFVQEKSVDLSRCCYLVLDEVDQLVLQPSFSGDVKYVLDDIRYKKRVEPKILMFNATVPPKRESLLYSREIVGDAELTTIICGEENMANKCIKQKVEKVLIKDSQPTMLLELLKIDLEKNKGNNNENEKVNHKVIVFVNGKTNILALIKFLHEGGISAELVRQFDASMGQKSRESTMNDFKSGKFPVLISTALATRGLDIVGLNHVINYNLPQLIGDYVLRIGRTGRMGNEGLATSFFDPDSPNDEHLEPELLKTVSSQNETDVARGINELSISVPFV